jgi:hypothetical protein
MYIEKITNDEYFSLISKLPIHEDEQKILLLQGYYCEYKKFSLYVSLRDTFFRKSLVWDIIECTHSDRVRNNNYDVFDYTLTEAIQDFVK